MRASRDLDTEELVHLASGGDGEASEALLARRRDQLRGMVAARMDRRLFRRVDPSDVVQEALSCAVRRLPEYLRQHPLPFHTWLWRIAFDEVVRQYRRHIRAGARTVTREQELVDVPPDCSAQLLADQLADRHTLPDDSLRRQEVQARVRQALGQLSPGDRELLVMRFLERRSTRETAGILGLTLNGLKSRQRKALARFNRIFGGWSGDDPS